MKDTDLFSDLRKKIVPMDRIAEMMKKARSSGKTIVTLNGAFDILHPGHIYFLREARKQGDILVVGVNSDASVRKNKGPTRPINGQESRAIMLAALPEVDYVTIFDQDTPITLIETIKPDVHCNGEEYGKDCVEAPALKRVGARLHLIPRLGSWSTTRIQEKAKKGW